MSDSSHQTEQRTQTAQEVRASLLEQLGTEQKIITALSDEELKMVAGGIGPKTAVAMSVGSVALAGGILGSGIGYGLSSAKAAATGGAVGVILGVGVGVSATVAKIHNADGAREAGGAREADVEMHTIR